MSDSLYPQLSSLSRGQGTPHLRTVQAPHLHGRTATTPCLKTLMLSLGSEEGFGAERRLWPKRD